MFDKITVLAADDDSVNLEMIEVMLAELNCRLLKAENGQRVMEILAMESSIDVVLLDLEMPIMDGFETIKQIKQSFTWKDIPVIVVTAGAREVTSTLSLGANDFIAKPFNPLELRLRVMNHVRTKRFADTAKQMNNILEQEVIKKTRALKEALELSKAAEYEISLRLGRAAEFRDLETGMHIHRISELSKHLASLAGLSSEECEILRFSSPLHDVGKIGIPDRILCKPGKLTQAEFEIIKRHTTIGSNMLADAEQYPVIKAGSVIALQHHEKWDGTGYPSGLKREEIHIFARIVAIVDVFDALLSERPYKRAFPFDQAIKIVKDGRGTFFDPALLDIFLRNIGSFVEIRAQLTDEPVTGRNPVAAQ